MTRGRSAERCARHCVACGSVLACGACGTVVGHFGPFNEWASEHAPRAMGLADVDLVAERGGAVAFFEAKSAGVRTLSRSQARMLAAMDRQARGYASLVRTATTAPNTPAGHVLDALDVSAAALDVDATLTPRGVYVVTLAGLDVGGTVYVNGTAVAPDALARMVACDSSAPDGLDGRTWPDGWPTRSGTQ